MRSLVRFPAVVTAFVLGLVAAPGCQKSVSVTPVSGKVTLDGEPVTSGQVAFVPADEGSGNKELSAGTIDANGEYKIKTAGKEGAPPGKYKETITPQMMPGADGKRPTLAFPEAYTTPRNTPITIEVVANPAPGAYDIKMTSGKKK